MLTIEEGKSHYWSVAKVFFDVAHGQQNLQMLYDCACEMNLQAQMGVKILKDTEQLLAVADEIPDEVEEE